MSTIFDPALLTTLKGSSTEIIVQKLKKFSAQRTSQQKQLLSIIDSYRKGRLVLVLGAGISIEHGLPDWSTLLQKLLLSTIPDIEETADRYRVLAEIFTKLFSPNPLIAARYLHNYYRNENHEDPHAFEKAIRAAIYEEIDMSKESELLKEIRQLCVAPGKSPTLDSIITYNYDDLLESYLTSIGIDIRFSPIHAAGMNPSPDELPIHHVHGYLPKEVDLTEKNRVTLSEDLYHQQYSDIYGWSNLVQINKFKDLNCIFIGISFSDPNLRRLLDIAKVQRGDTEIHHYHFRKRYHKGEIEDKLKGFLDQHKDILDEKEKAELKLDETVTHLVTIMEKFEEIDAASFGVGTFWVNQYDEIPEYMAKIRKMDGTLL